MIILASKTYGGVGAASESRSRSGGHAWSDC
jgi:hypothetical protein